MLLSEWDFESNSFLSECSISLSTREEFVVYLRPVLLLLLNVCSSSVGPTNGPGCFIGGVYHKTNGNQSSVDSRQFCKWLIDV